MIVILMLLYSPFDVGAELLVKSHISVSSSQPNLLVNICTNSGLSEHSSYRKTEIVCMN
jgi:hypothetical protein